MASVFNSSNSNTNLVLATDTSFTGRWEDLQSYTSVISTIETGADTSGTVYLDWLNMDDDDVPQTGATALVSDTYTFTPDTVFTKQFDTRARWFRLRIQGDGSLSQVATTYKKAPTEIKLSDDNTNIVSVNLGESNQNSLYTILTDISGNAIGTTNDSHSGEAVFTHLADACGSSLATTDNYRDITRTLAASPDMSFVFTSELPTGSQGTFIVESNRLRLPKSQVPFRNGDIVRVAMGAVGDLDFCVGDAFETPTSPEGAVRFEAEVRYREVENDHVQFQLLVGQNMAEWFDPTVGFTNFDPSHFNEPTQISTSFAATATDGFAYLLDSCLGELPKVSDYYSIFADASGFDLSSAGIALTPPTSKAATYPVDLRFFRGSLEDDDSNTHVLSFDLSVANDPAESLAVALRDNDNLNIRSTGASGDSYIYHSTRSQQRNILFLVEISKALNENTSPAETRAGVIVNNIRDELVTPLNTILGGQATTAVAAYNSGTYPIFDPAQTSDTTPNTIGSVATPLNSSIGQWDGDYTTMKLNALPDGSANYWQALRNYVEHEDADTCFSSIFTASLDTVVLIAAQDSSSSAADRNSFDACFSNFWGQTERYAIAPNVTSDLLSFTGSTDNIYTVNTSFDGTQANLLAELTTIGNALSTRLAGIKHTSNNAMAVHTSDVCGHSQAGTMAIGDAQFGDVALYYALADSCGTQLDTTQATDTCVGLNAMYVSLVTKVNPDGTAIEPSAVNSDRPLHITFDAEFHPGKTFDLTVSGHPVTMSDISNNTFNLKHLGIANETATPIWIKLYDMSYGKYIDISGAVENPTTGNLDASAVTLQDELMYNLAVPGLDYRDFDFIKGVKVNNGLYVVASTNYRYDSFQFPPGNKHIYVHGTYQELSS